VVAYDFTKNRQFGAKTDWNSVFIGRDPYIVDRLYIIALYIHFMDFKKSNFCSKSIVVSLRFYRKSPVWGKNWPTLCISWWWPPYRRSVIHNGHVTEFLGVLKEFKFLLKNSYVLAYGFTQNRHFWAKTDRNSIILGRDPHIADHLYITYPYMIFKGFKKTQIFGQNS
jgi:hypothetical protein